MRFDHVGVLVEDLDAAIAFARDVLGLGDPATEIRLDEHGLSAAFFPWGNGRLEVLRFDDPTRRAGIDHIALEVDDLDATAARLRAHGVRFSGPRLPDEVTEPIHMRGRRHLWSVPETTGGVMYQFTEASD